MVFAQNVQVSGTVTDENGFPVIGVSVTVAGTTQGIATDIDGKYVINAPSNGTLLFSFLGYADVKEEIKGRSVINVQMQPDAEDIDEVMVVAYGTVKKVAYTGAASTVDKDQLSKSQASSFTQMLAGNTTGVHSISSSGQPGANATVYIRGISTISATSTPLYIIDGAPFDGNLATINPADIESINVLKDAASTSLYGSRAANGLIIVTTKQGKKNQAARIDASFKYGISSRAQKPYERVDAKTLMELSWEVLRNDAITQGHADAAQRATNNLIGYLGINPYGPKYPNPVGTDGKVVSGAELLWNDNWLKEYEGGASRTEAQVSMSGGANNVSYYVSFGYLNDIGLAPGSDLERYTGRVNLRADLKPWMRLNANIALTSSTQLAPAGTDSSSANALFTGLLIPNIYPVYARDLTTGAYLKDLNGDKIPDFGDNANGIQRPSGASQNSNHIGSTKYDLDRYKRSMASIRASLEIDIVKNLTYTGSFNTDYNMNNSHTYRNPKFGGSSSGETPGSVSISNALTTSYTANNILTYRNNFDSHDIKVLAGHEYYQYDYSYISGSRSGFSEIGYIWPSMASTVTGFNGNADIYKLLSFFGNAEYNYDMKYFFTGALRTDASSRFYKDTRWGVFWSLSGSWRISEEDFLKNSNTVSRLTLRASYGSQGNDGVGYYAWQGLYASYSNLGEIGWRTSSLPNYGMEWEKNKMFNVGIDFGFFRNRLTGTVEFFNRSTKDMLFSIPRPASIGYTSYTANNGDMRNRGFEVELTGTPVHTRDWKWTISANATHYKNKITRIPVESLGTYTYRKNGGSMYDFFIAEWAGINPENGMPQWWKTDANGNRVKTGIYTEASQENSRIWAGSALPDLMGGFSTSVSYKGFEVYALFSYKIGGYLYDSDKPFILGTVQGRAMSTELLDRWTPENTNATAPRLQGSYQYGWTSVSTRWLHDASYLRMKNATISYDLPKKMLNKIGISSCKVYLQGENVFTLFGTEGLDPEQSISGITAQRYPNMRTFSLGINLSF